MVGRAQDAGLDRAGAYGELAAGRERLPGGKAVPGLGMRAGAAGQGVGNAGGQQDEVAGHEPDAGLAADAQPRGAVGDGVEGRAGHGIQRQAPGLGGVDGGRDRPAHASHGEDGGQGIHRITLAVQALIASL